MKNLFRFKPSSLLIVIACLFPSTAFTQTSQETIAALKHTYEIMENIKADFTQTVRFYDFDTKATSQGKVFLKKGKMRWDYLAPHRQQIFVEDDQIVHYVPEHQQVMKSKRSRQRELPVDLFAGIGKIEKLFKISQKRKNELVLIPQEKESPITQMILTLTSAPINKGLLIKKLVLHEQNGNQSTFLFKDFRMNQTFQTDPFVFNIPEGVEVIEAQ